MPRNLGSIMTLIKDLIDLKFRFNAIITGTIWIIKLNNRLKVSIYITYITKRLNKVTSYKEATIGY